MNNNFKKLFFSSLLTVLLVVSNLIGNKYTNCLGLIISVDFITYPFILLCILLLLDFGSKKETYQSILSTIFIQVFILLSYTLAVNLGSQAVIPDIASSVNSVFQVSEYRIIASLIGFMVSNYILIYIYEYFKMIGYKLLGVSLGTVASLIVYGLIFIPICHYDLGFSLLLNLLLCHVIMAILMTLLVVVLFYLLKDKENIYEVPRIFLPNTNLPASNAQTLHDEDILEVISKKEEVKPRKKKTTKNTTRKTSNTKSTQKKSDNKSKTKDK